MHRYRVLHWLLYQLSWGGCLWLVEGIVGIGEYVGKLLGGCGLLDFLVDSLGVCLSWRHQLAQIARTIHVVAVLLLQFLEDGREVIDSLVQLALVGLLSGLEFQSMDHRGGLEVSSLSLMVILQFKSVPIIFSISLHEFTLRHGLIIETIWFWLLRCFNIL